jgi:3-phenylpropionate/trans-cinnamate dioxygenase ferredoxin subunit
VGRHAAAKLHELAAGELACVAVVGVAVCLGRTDDGEAFALDDLCPHEEACLSEGRLVGRAVECPEHLSRFDIATGEALRWPATDPATIYPVDIDGDVVYVTVPD